MSNNMKTNNLAELINEYGVLSAAIGTVDRSDSDAVYDAIKRQTGYDGASFVNMSALHTLDKLDSLAFAISFAEPATKDEAIFLLAFGAMKKQEAIDCKGDIYVYRRDMRLAERCVTNACRYLLEKIDGDISDAMKLIGLKTRKIEPHDDGAHGFISSIRQHAA